MRIALLYGNLSRGGGTYQLLQLAHCLLQTNEVTLFALSNNTEGSYDYLLRDINVIINKKKIKRKGKISFLFESFSDCLRLTSLVLHNWQSFDVLNPHEWNSHWAAVVIKIVKRVPVVWMCNDVWHIPGLEERQEERVLFRWFNKTIRFVTDKIIVKMVDKIIVLDNRIKEIIEQKYNKKAIVVRSGVDLSLYSAIANLKKKRSKKITFLCLSIFFPHRRFEDAIAAFDEYIKFKSSAKLVIIGNSSFDPTYYNQIKRLIQKLNLRNHIKVISEFVSEKQKSQYIRECDVFIFPNIFQTWGIAAIEAMAAGKPCIVSNGSGVHEIIKNGVNGYTYNAGDAKDLFKKMKILGESKELREKIGKYAQHFVETNFSWEKYSQKMLSEFRGVVS